MELREGWRSKIELGWLRAPIIWLSGVRRVGKTTLAKSLDKVEYFNCDLPSVVDRLSDPETFFSSISSSRITLDEIHRLPDPSRVLKIAADEYPKLKILATGSSTLDATKKFSDSLTGRKRNVHLLPVLCDELPIFNDIPIETRIKHGGLPAALLAEHYSPDLYAEWLDSFYARDIQELFRIEKRTQFLKLFRLLLFQNGGLVDISKLAGDTELSRPTVMNYLEALRISHAIYILRPYHKGKRRELVRQPKVYGFDTGFVVFAKGWKEIRADDLGILWENIVLESLLSIFSQEQIQFWRDEAKREVDFVIPRGTQSCDTIECKWNPSRFEADALAIFRSAYKQGDNYVVCPYLKDSYKKTLNGIKVSFMNLKDLIQALGA